MTTQRIEAGTGETERLDGEAMKARSAQADAPDHPTATDYRNRAERAEAECKELRERLAGQDRKHIDPEKLVSAINELEKRSLRQHQNFVAPIFAGIFQMLANAVKQSTTNGS